MASFSQSTPTPMIDIKYGSLSNVPPKLNRKKRRPTRESLDFLNSIVSIPYWIWNRIGTREENIGLFLSFMSFLGPAWRIFVQNFGRTLRGSKSPHVPTAMPVCYREQKKLTNLRHGYKLHEYFMRGRENRNCERRSL